MANATTFPTITGWTEYEQALERLNDLTAQSIQASREAEATDKGEPQAVAADDRAQAQALTEGAKDPGRKHHTAWKKHAEDAATKVRVLTEATSQARAAVLALLDQDDERAVQAAEANVAAATDAYRANLKGILAARDQFWQTRRALAWLTTGKPQGQRFKASPAPGLATLANPLIRGGDALPADVALAAFKAEVDPPAPEQKAHGRMMRVERQFSNGGQGNTVEQTTYRSIPLGANGKPLTPA